MVVFTNAQIVCVYVCVSRLVLKKYTAVHKALGMGWDLFCEVTVAFAGSEQAA